MSELEEEGNVVEKKPRLSLKERLRRIFIAIVLLIIFVPIFGREVPRLLFGVGKENSTETAAEKPMDKITDNTPEITPQKPEEKNKETIVKDVIKEPTPVAEPIVETKDNERLHSLEEKISTLEEAHKIEISELKKKIETQESTAQNNTKNIENMFLAVTAFSQLKKALENGEAYSENLNQLKKLTENHSEIADIITKLSPASKQGITTRTALAKEFNLLAKQAMTANDSGWFINLFHKFIVIRKIGEQVGDNDESVLARAEVKLVQSDLKATLKELEQLSPPAKEVFNKWDAQANNLLDAQINLDKLQLLLTKIELITQP